MSTSNQSLLTDMLLQDVVLVLECALSFLSIVIDIVIETLSKKVEAVELMQAFDVRWESAAVFFIHLDLVGSEANFLSELLRYEHTTVWQSVSVDVRDVGISAYSSRPVLPTQHRPLDWLLDDRCSHSGTIR